MATDVPLWTPGADRTDAAGVTRFRRTLAATEGADLPDSSTLQAYALAHPAAFWDAVWRQFGVVGDRGEGPAFVDGIDLPGARFFPGAQLNYAENLLAGATHAPAGADGTALVHVREDDVSRTLSWRELTAQAAALAAHLRGLGVQPGDRVAAWMPNTPETVATLIAATMVGAVFTSTPARLGAADVIDRFGPLQPTVLVAADGHLFAGSRQPHMAGLRDLVARLPGLRGVVVVGELDRSPDVAGLPGARLLTEALDEHAGAAPQFQRMPFDHPGLVLHGSGSARRAIVHRGAGVLLKHLSEHRLHCDVRPGDHVLHATAPGATMWHWLVSALASGATVVLYDGSPFHPSPDRMWRLADELGVTLLGTSAELLQASAKAGVDPAATYDLARLRTITSTGSALPVQGFDYVYEHVKSDVHLASVSGSADICGFLVAGDPTRPVYPGEIQGPALGMAVDVLDEDGRSLRDAPGVPGELVCGHPFPSMPVGLWADHDESRYRAAYLERFPGAWSGGDVASWTPHHGIEVHEGAGAALNATRAAELCRQVELLPQVAEALALGPDRDDDTRTVLFLRLVEGADLDDALRDAVRHRLLTLDLAADVVELPGRRALPATS